MAKLKYDGPFDAIDIPSLGIENLAKGETFEVPDEACAGLAIQAEQFEPADKRAKDILRDHLAALASAEADVADDQSIDEPTDEPTQEG